MIKINAIKSNIYECSFSNRYSAISFNGRTRIKPDTFEKECVYKNFDMYMYNPHTNSYNHSVVSINLTQPQKIKLKNNSKASKADVELNLDYNSERFDFLWDKKRGCKLKTVILISHSGKFETAYHFMSPKLDKEYGYVNLVDYFGKLPDKYKNNFMEEELFKDYKAQGITGPRVIVDYLENFDDKSVGGVGKLADKLAVKHCLDKNIEPNIISVADYNSHVAHYLRGKRFFPLKKFSDAYDYFKCVYKETDVNKILEKLIENSKSTGVRIDISQWGILPMYMPKELAMKYIEELKIHPIL